MYLQAALTAAEGGRQCNPAGIRGPAAGTAWRRSVPAAGSAACAQSASTQWSASQTRGTRRRVSCLLHSPLPPLCTPLRALPLPPFPTSLSLSVSLPCASPSITSVGLLSRRNLAAAMPATNAMPHPFLGSGQQWCQHSGQDNTQLGRQEAQPLTARAVLCACSFAHPRDNPFTGSEVSRGSKVHEVKLLSLDEAGNKLDLGPDEVRC